MNLIVFKKTKFKISKRKVEEETKNILNQQKTNSKHVNVNLTLQ